MRTMDLKDYYSYLCDMELRTKSFPEFSVDELYDMLKLRSEVFVVEQDCVYLDMDDRDQNAIHVIAVDGGRIVGCLRVFEKDERTGQIGRVVTSRDVRGTGCGALLMKEAVRVSEQVLGKSSTYLEAQVYAIGFYEKHGFVVVSEEFLEDGIPHVQMVRTAPAAEETIEQ